MAEYRAPQMAPGERFALSPQAQRRLQRAMTEGELSDLARDIAEAIEAETAPGYVLGEVERLAIFNALTVDR